MHELGRTRGLHHGGRDDLNHKPNYKRNELRSLGVSKQHAITPRWHPPYATVMTNTLNEFSLDEYLGIGGLQRGVCSARASTASP